MCDIFFFSMHIGMKWTYSICTLITRLMLQETSESNSKLLLVINSVIVYVQLYFTLIYFAIRL